MSKVVSDLESLIEFRSHLIRFNQTLGEEFSSMRSHYHHLGDAWSDAKYDQFGQALKEAGQGIDRYLAVTSDHETHLLRLIETLRNYLDQRI